jgi:hypothetical protein
MMGPASLVGLTAQRAYQRSLNVDERLESGGGLTLSPVGAQAWVGATTCFRKRRHQQAMIPYIPTKLLP